MDRSETESSRLKAEDFRRLGVRPQEWRPTIIRQAAARTARELAQQQLDAPTDETGRELSEVTVSTYRVLDPRRRDDSSERASIGRILPVALNAASRTKFCDGRPEPQVSQTLSIGTTSHVEQDLGEEVAYTDAAFGIVVADHSTPGAAPVTNAAVASRMPETAFDPGHLIARRLESDSLLEVRPLDRFIASFRRQLSKPAFIVGLIALMMVATVWVGRTSRINSLVAETDPDITDPDEVPSAVPSSSGAKDLASMRGEGPTQSSPPKSGVVTDEAAPVNTGSDQTFDDGETGSSVTSQSRDISPSDQMSSDDLAKLLRQAATWIVDLSASVDSAFASSKDQSNTGFLPDPFSTIEAETTAEPDTFAANQPLPVPSDQQQDEAYQRLRGRLPELTGVVSPTSAPNLLMRLSEVQSESIPGSAESWVASMIAAKIGWSVLDPEHVCDGLRGLAKTHEVSLEPLMAETFLSRHAFVETRDSHLNVLQSGFVVAEALLRSQSLQQSQQVVALSKRSAEFLGDRAAMVHLEDYDAALDQMARLRLKANDIVRWADEQQVSAGDAAIAGRYHCLFLRDWTGGLKWLAASKDPRMGPLAKEELQLRDRPVFAVGESGDDTHQTLVDQSRARELSRLASRWLAIASRSEGRVAESMRLHALVLNEQAIRIARGTTRLKIQREIDEIRDLLSNFTIDSQPFSVLASRTL